MCTIQLFEDDIAIESHEGRKQNNVVVVVVVVLTYQLSSVQSLSHVQLFAIS